MWIACRFKIISKINYRFAVRTDRYGKQMLPSHRKTLDAMLACRSHCGEFYTHCDSCNRHGVFPLSCGHRSCPQCQHHLCEGWLQRQQTKLLPTDYFMVTLPKQLRSTAWQHQSIMYDILFRASDASYLLQQHTSKNTFNG